MVEVDIAGEIVSPQSLKYLPLGVLEKKFAKPGLFSQATIIDVLVVFNLLFF